AGRAGRAPVRGERLHPGDPVPTAAVVWLPVDHAERLEPGAELRGCAAYPFGHAAHLTVATGEHGDDAVGLTQLMGAQHDRFVPVQLHCSIVPDGSSSARRLARDHRTQPSATAPRRRMPHPAAGCRTPPPDATPHTPPSPVASLHPLR